MMLHIVEFAVLLLVIGAITGFAAGLFGIGGGTILVPAFLTVFPFFQTSSDVAMHCAVGTSLALVIPTSIIAVKKHRRYGNFDMDFYKRWVPFVLIGALIGVFLIHVVSSMSLAITFTAYLYFTVVMVSLRRPLIKTSDRDGPKGALRAVGAIGVGSVSTLLGMGGGPFTVPFLRGFNYPFLKAIAISSATAIVIGFVGALGAISAGWGVPGRVPYSIGYVNVLSFFLVAPTAMLMSSRGTKLAYNLDKKVLRRSYVALLLAIALYMTFKVIHF